MGRTARGDRSMMAQCGTIASAETTDGRTSRLRDDPVMERKAFENRIVAVTTKGGRHDEGKARGFQA